MTLIRLRKRQAAKADIVSHLQGTLARAFARNILTRNPLTANTCKHHLQLDTQAKLQKNVNDDAMMSTRSHGNVSAVDGLTLSSACKTLPSSLKASTKIRTMLNSPLTDFIQQTYRPSFFPSRESTECLFLLLKRQASVGKNAGCFSSAGVRRSAPPWLVGHHFTTTAGPSDNVSSAQQFAILYPWLPITPQAESSLNPKTS
jgi:hypothetical protein